MFRSLLLVALALSVAACAAVDPSRRPATGAPVVSAPVVDDPHSYANTEAFRVQHVALDLRVDFAKRRLTGNAQLQLRRVDADATTLVLDTRDLDVRGVSVGRDDGTFVPTTFALDAADPILGSALRIELPPTAAVVRIDYATRPQASALQWLSPSQTTDGKHPFLYTQSQAIHARSWIPLQDTPQVRTTYSARIRTPDNLVAVMSADFDLESPRNGDYHFEMTQPIPSYLIALAVGDLHFRATGPRTGVFAEPSMVERAAREFEDTEAMIQRCEAIFGPYRWGRYDLLILPKSFPYGGMENPRLTFATPTVITGDKALVSLVAHELAHSWSGNLVTNATWNEFWLNEGFTNHLTYRIMEEVYGVDRGMQERALGANDLKETLARLQDQNNPASDRTLAPEMTGRDPDDGVTDVPYERGALFLAYLEAKFGRETFDAFLRGWFERHAFQSVTTPQFIDELDRRLLRRRPGVVSRADVDAWLHSPQMPQDTVWPHSDAFARVDAARAAWLAGTPARELATTDWNLRQWQYFLDNMPDTLDTAQLRELDQTFALSQTGNAVLGSRWFRLAARHAYLPAYPAMKQHLLTVGRMLLITPVYRELARRPSGLAHAKRLYRQARTTYHPIARDAVEKVLHITN